MRMREKGPPGPALSPAPSHLALNPLSVLSEPIRMAPGTLGEGRPADFLKAASGGSSEPTACLALCALERSPLRLPCSAPHHEYMAPGLRVACPSSASFAFPSPAGRTFLFRPPGVLLSKPGGQKIAWAFVGLSHPGLEFLPFSGGALWHTRSTRQRDERQCL
jgi:hypothetical protein